MLHNTGLCYNTFIQSKSDLSIRTFVSQCGYLGLFYYYYCEKSILSLNQLRIPDYKIFICIFQSESLCFINGRTTDLVQFLSGTACMMYPVLVETYSTNMCYAQTTKTH